jgi:hypothetical protein
MGKSLDKVVLSVKLTSRQHQGITRSPQNGGLFISGLTLEGALFDSTDFILKSANTRQISSSLPVLHVYSMLVEEKSKTKKEQAEEDDSDTATSLYDCPVYADRCRGKSHLFNVPFPCKRNDHVVEKWTVQGVAVVLQGDV